MKAFQGLTRIGIMAVTQAAAVGVLASTTAAAQCVYPLTTQVFATVPFPGYPEGIVVADNGTVYVGTHQNASGAPNVASHVFAYDENGSLTRDYVIQGQADQNQGITGMAQGKDGLLYILDRHPTRMITLNPRTGEQRPYASFRDVPPCSDTQATDCSATVNDQPAFPDDVAFGPDGAAYVTDIAQGLIWRVPPGGGEAEVWFTDSRLESVFGPNGIRFLDDGTLVFAQTLDAVMDPEDMFIGAGRIYTLPVKADGQPGNLRVLWQGAPGEAPDGLAIGKSGQIYVTLANGACLLVLSRYGEEIARTAAGESPIPYDNPAGVAFYGKRVLIANQATISGTSRNFAVLDVNVGETGMELFRP